MHFIILTLFPEAIEPYLAASILGRAQEQKLMEIRLVSIRDYATDKHHTVDDTPYGGGAGMVMKVEPIDRALQALKAQNQDHPSTVSSGSNGKAQTKHKAQDAKAKLPSGRGNQTARTVVMSARGEPFTQRKAEEYAKLDELILIAGRYEGIDQRVADHLADEELSIGPYVLAGGELPALVIVEAVTRLIPGVIGNPASLTEESDWKLSRPAGSGKAGKIENWKLAPEHAQYTKPEDYRGWKVPPVLLSGDHGKIKEWRKVQKP